VNHPEKEIVMASFRFDQLTRRLGARASRRTALGAALAGLGLAGLDSLAAAQDATPAPGASPPADGDKPVFMFVQTFASGRGEVNPAAGTPVAEGTPTPSGGAPFLLRLEGHSGQTIYFSDRPDRIVGAVPTEDFLETLGFTPFNPPNAALVAEFASGQGVIVLELIEPVYDAAAATLTYGAEGLGTFAGERLEPVARDKVVEQLPAEFGPAALFIDDCPDITACLRSSNFIAWIPGGPYGQCWQGLFQGGCQPCWHTRDELDALCNSTFADRCDGRCRADAYSEGRPLY
jgi:hypothetical protein